jgi:hypothetical protein
MASCFKGEMNIQEATPIALTEQERSALEAMIRSAKTEYGIVERARIVLLAAEGRSTRSIAAELGTWPERVSRWRGARPPPAPWSSWFRPMQHADREYAHRWIV